jgi:hypothetical protein
LVIQFLLQALIGAGATGPAISGLRILVNGPEPLAVWRAGRTP